MGEQHAQRVGLKKPNAWGLKDMHGNVWEWCSDWYARERTGGLDPVEPSSGTSRVYRGGSWNSLTMGCRTAFRGNLSPDDRYNFLGFRVAAVQSR